jgi:ABC-type Fe3+ transport system substrate-binding protein
VRYKESYVEIDSEDHEAMTDDHKYTSSPYSHNSYNQKNLVEPFKPMYLPRDVAVIKKILAWIHDTL